VIKELFVLLRPVLWSVKNDIIRFNRSFYKKILFYSAASVFFISVVTKLLNIGMTRLQSLSPEVFNLLLIKGYSLIFIIIFFIQIINGAVISLNSYYQAKDLEVLFTSPVNRTSLFFSRLFETHLKASWMLIIFGIPLLVSSGLLFHAGIFYYIYALALFFAFSTIPVNIGAGITMFLSKVFNAGQLKKYLLSMGVIAAILLVTLLRIFKPERLVNPELFANLTLFVTGIKAPSFVLLPNRWLSEALFNFLGKVFTGDTLVHVSLLLLTAYVTTFLLEVVFRRCHFEGWGRLQEGGIALRERFASQGGSARRGLGTSKLIDPLTRLFDVRSGILLKKDIFVQMRDVKNVHQALILLSLILIYLFSVASLPLNWEGYTVQLKYMVAFFNLGLILIIIAALCSRLIYPSIVSEGASLWLMKTSPISPARYIWTKFLFYFVPIFILSQLLIISSSVFIGVERPVMALKMVTAALLCSSLVSMTIAFGISDLKRAASDSAQEKGRGESTALMLLSVFLILFTLVLEIIPTFLYFLKEAQRAALTEKSWLMIGAVLFVLFLVNLVVAVLSMRLSVRRFEKLEPG
jgi:ABC-2 type transport system permease protein